MPIRATLLTELQAALGSLITPSITTASAAGDVFEAYVFGIVLEAARVEGALIAYEDVYGTRPSTFVFRTSPGYIFSTAQPYTHAIIEFPNKPLLEAHVGVRVTGKSGVLHECDVVVLHRDEALTCRMNNVSPRCAKVVLAIECKFYTATLPLGLARGFIGLTSDLSVKGCYLVYNNASTAVEQLLTERSRHWGHKVVPSSADTVTRLRNQLQVAFQGFKSARG